MGNCCIHGSSSTVWAGDDWGSVRQEMKRRQDHNTSLERQKLLGEDTTGSSSIPSSSMREVKIKITKRELEELMARVELQGLTIEQVVAGLIKSGDEFQMVEIMDHHHHHRSWKPALQSIPEVN